METIKLHQFREKLELHGYSKRVQEDYPDTVRLFFDYLEQEEDVHSVNDITLEHITAYQVYLQYKRRPNGKYLSTVSVRRRLEAVKCFYRIMYQEKLISQNLDPEIITPKRQQSLPKHVPSEKDVKTLLDSVKPINAITKRDRAILELLYATAIRNAELRNLTLDKLDLTGKTIFVTGKGSKDRVLPVGDWVMPWLVEYLEVVRPKLVQKREPTTLVFVSKHGRQITKGNLIDLVEKYTKRVGLTLPITPHSLRHACATHLLHNGADIRYVQELLGHADLSATQIYTKIDITHLKKAHRQYHPRERNDNES